MRGQALLAVSVLSAALMAAQPAMAQNYSSYHDAHVAQSERCEQARRGNTAGGAILGGILGAVVGSQVAGRGHRTDGSVVGGAAGALLGGAIGNDSTRRSCAQVQGNYDPYYGQAQDPRYAQQDPRYDPRYAQNDPRYSQEDLYGGPDDPRYGGRDPRYGGDDRRYRADARTGGRCRWGEIESYDRRGRPVIQEVYMCRGRDGVWRVQQG